MPSVAFSAVFMLASVTDSLVTFATHVIRDLGLPGIYGLMILPAMGIPFPSEGTMLFAGFDVSNGHWSLPLVTLVGVLGDATGCTIAYAIGYYGRLELVEHHGAKIHITAARMQRAESWFERRGTPAVLFGRMLPVIRSFVSFPAGAARMPYPRFLILSLIGAIPWVLGFAAIGDGVGNRWTQWRDRLHYVDYAVLALIVIGIVYLVVRRRGRGGPGEPAADASG